MSGSESWGTNSIEERRSDRQSRSKPYSELQQFFLLRLERMLRVRREHAALASSEDNWSRLLSKAIYSSYCDCIELKVGGDAKTLLARDQAAAEG